MVTFTKAHFINGNCSDNKFCCAVGSRNLVSDDDTIILVNLLYVGSCTVVLWEYGAVGSGFTVFEGNPTTDACCFK